MKKTIIGVLISNFSAAGIGFLLNIILARLLSVEEYGRISLVLVSIIVIFTIFEFGFNNSSVVFYNRFKDKYRDIEIFLNKLYTKYLILIIIPIIVFVYILKVFYNYTPLETSIVVINIFVFSIYRYIIAIYQAKAEWKTYNTLNILSNFMKLIVLLSFMLVYYWLEGSNYYNMVLISYGISAGIVLFITLYISKQYEFLKSNIKNDKNIFNDFKNIIIPIGISNIFIIISMRADVFFIEKYLGEGQLGIYMAANSLALVFPLITSSLMNVFIQKSAHDKTGFLDKILQQQKKYIPYLVLILSASVLSAKPLFLILFGERYIESIDIFQILLIAYIGGIFFTPLESYFYSHNQKIILFMRFIQMVVIILGLLLFLDSFGLVAVAYIIVFSRVVGWCIMYFNIYKNKKESLCLEE